MWLYLYSYISYLGNMLECCILCGTATCTVVYQDLSPSRKVSEGLAIVTSMHGLLTNQILLFNFETVLITLASVCKTFLEGERRAWLFNCNTILCILDHIHITAGVDSEIEEGGSIHIEWGLVRRA